jgi:DNA topoisomerase VI subunit B
MYELIFMVKKQQTIESIIRQMAVKSCKVATKNVSDMGKELSRISQVSSVGALADQMAEAEQSKTEVETQLQERVRPFLFSYTQLL